MKRFLPTPFVASRLRSFGYAFAGIAYLVRSQPNAWLHLVCTATVIALAVMVRVSLLEWCWLIAAIGSVWFAEAMNTALELLADATCPRHHPLIGRAKDVAAAAVLLAAVGAAAIGLCILGPRISGLF